MAGRAKPGTTEFSSDRMRLLAAAGLVTDRVMEAAVARVVLGEKLPASLSESERKVALLLVREINPDETIEQGEEAILRGLKKDTLKGYKDDHLYPRLINGTVALSAPCQR